MSVAQSGVRREVIVPILKQTEASYKDLLVSQSCQMALILAHYRARDRNLRFLCEYRTILFIVCHCRWRKSS